MNIHDITKYNMITSCNPLQESRSDSEHYSQNEGGCSAELSQLKSGQGHMAKHKHNWEVMMLGKNTWWSNTLAHSGANYYLDNYYC